MDWAHMTAADGFALAMIAVILAGFGVLLVLFLSMRRHAGRRDPEVDELLREVALMEKAAGGRPAGATESRQAWERRADWWKC